jgi:hypothetical protein
MYINASRSRRSDVQFSVPVLFNRPDERRVFFALKDKRTGFEDAFFGETGLMLELSDRPDKSSLVLISPAFAERLELKTLDDAALWVRNKLEAYLTKHS